MVRRRAQSSAANRWGRPGGREQRAADDKSLIFKHKVLPDDLLKLPFPVNF
jgi:hypothetical protein